MRVTTRTGVRERMVLTAMIVSRKALARIASKWADGMFDSDASNIIGQWCVDHYKKYGEAPGRQIEGIYERWASVSKNKEASKLIDKYLTELGGEYRRLRKELNDDLVIDQAGELFNKVRLQKIGEEIVDLVSDGKASKGWQLINASKPIELGVEEAIDPLADVEAIEDAFDKRYEPLIKYGLKSLDKFFGSRLRRGAFVAFEGIEKIGKTWWLIDMAWRGMLQNRRVALFEIGDMTQEDMILRLASRAAEKPIDPVKYRIPKKLYLDEKGNPDVRFMERTTKLPLTKEEAVEALASFRVKKKSYLKLVTVPAGTITVNGIETRVEEWIRDGWTPDLIVIDYADLLAPVDGRMETRDQINQNWLKLRSMSQKYHSLVVTATQADAAAYDARVLTRSNFSNDKRKLAHVTCMVGINQTPNEEQVQVQRLNFVVNREGRYYSKQCCHVAGCLDIGNPAIKSRFDQGNS